MNKQFSNRIKSLGLPLEQCIVLGSGILDELGIRSSGDIDLVVTSGLFAELRQRSGWSLVQKQGFDVLVNEEYNVEAWLDWEFAERRQDYDDLLPDTELHNGVRFVSLDYVRRWKQWRGREKDLVDIELIDNYRSAQL